MDPLVVFPLPDADTVDLEDPRIELLRTALHDLELSCLMDQERMRLLTTFYMVPVKIGTRHQPKPPDFKVQTVGRTKGRTEGEGTLQVACRPDVVLPHLREARRQAAGDGGRLGLRERVM